MGRGAELAQLHRWLEKALGGERQVVFVTGEPGIGKTTLVEAFLVGIRDWGLGVGPLSSQTLSSKSQVASRLTQHSGLNTQDRSSLAPNPQHPTPSLWLGHGQCIEHFGAGEAYLPVLEALGQLCRQPGHERFIELLTRYAPTWLVQLPWLLTRAEQESLQRQVMGAPRERMLREMAELVQALTTEAPLVLVVEDLQWSDYSTLDLLAFLARRRETARLLFVGTYRPVDVILRDHPLKGVKQEMVMHGRCAELPLELLTEKVVAEYLSVRFGEAAVRELSLQELARRIHQRTDGNPLFMVNLVDYLVAQGVIVREGGSDRTPVPVEPGRLKEKVEALTLGVPTNVRQMIAVQLEELTPEERRVLEAASVVGVEFAAPTVAAALQEGTVRVAEWCEGLTRRGQFLRPTGVSEWPDGTVTASYGFLHALYQETLYEQVTATRLVEFHRRIGVRQETAYGDRVGEIAAALAVHFEEGREYGRAVQHLQRAAENALQRSAHREAINHLTKALDLLKVLPDTPERDRQELTLQIALGPA
ncbi:MAG: AAA family ATPase [Deltaproteobacteria bacterium]|nr:AAA family ATPase [Deltaproteobacteria bacterium]